MNKSSPNIYIVAILAGGIGGLIAITGLLLSGAYPQIKSNATYSGTISFIYEWQTLIGAFIALLAAIITVRTMRQQFQAHQLAAAKSAKTLLPATLTQIVEFSELLWTTYEEIGNQLLEQNLTRTRPPKEFPTLPDNVIRDLVEAVKLASDDKVISKIIVLGRRLQVAGSWNRGFVTRMTVSSRDVEEMLYKCVEIHSLSSDIFDFTDSEQHPSRNVFSLQNALNNLDRSRQSNFRPAIENRLEGLMNRDTLNE